VVRAVREDQEARVVLAVQEVQAAKVAKADLQAPADLEALAALAAVAAVAPQAPAELEVRLAAVQDPEDLMGLFRSPTLLRPLPFPSSASPSLLL
jgi:hypothetical protein